MSKKSTPERTHKNLSRTPLERQPPVAHKPLRLSASRNPTPMRLPVLLDLPTTSQSPRKHIQTLGIFCRYRQHKTVHQVSPPHPVRSPDHPMHRSHLVHVSLQDHPAPHPPAPALPDQSPGEDQPLHEPRSPDPKLPLPKADQPRLKEPPACRLAARQPVQLPPARRERLALGQLAGDQFPPGVGVTPMEHHRPGGGEPDPSASQCKLVAPAAAHCRTANLADPVHMTPLYRFLACSEHALFTSFIAPSFSSYVTRCCATRNA